MRFLVRLLVTAAALWVAIRLVPGIRYDGSGWTLLVVALVFGIVNAVVRPLLVFLTCPLILLTLGLFLLVLNALMLLLTAWAAGMLGFGFEVDGFAAALVGAVIVSLVSAVLNVFVGEPEAPRRRE